ncbi:hypothetical protein VNO78_22292 [Psophocarpus tetragonolobus]|uniref:Uncharacterized protein n=1 Tax=Psophocarpus tetragonolobus TaxID=3891 RepID=A0AAN9XJ18_PSOTE
MFLSKKAVLKCLKLGACEYHHRHHYHGFGKLSMGNEMGNNNTSTIKEEDNVSIAEKKSFQEDNSKLANGMSKDIHEDSAKEENLNIPASIANDDMEKASNDIANELRKDIWQEEGHGKDVKGNTETAITTDEGKDEDTQEKAVGFTSNDTPTMLEKDSMEGYTHARDVNMENQMPPTAEDIQEEATGLNSNNTESMIANDSLGEGTCKSDMDIKIKMHPTAEVEGLQDKPTGMASDYSRSSLENDLLKGDAPEDDVNVDHQNHQTVECKVDKKQMAARLDFDDQTSEFEDKSQEDKQDGNVVSPTTNGFDVQGNTIISVSEAPLNWTNSFEGSGDEITEVRQPEKSPIDGLVEAKGDNSVSLSSSSLEGTEEYEKQEETRLREYLSITYNHQLNNRHSIQQGDEKTEVRQPEKSPNDDGSVEDKGGKSEWFSSSSLQSTEEYDKLEKTCSRELLLVTDNHRLDNDRSIQQGDETTKVGQPENSPNDGSVEAKGEHPKSLSNSSLKSIEECKKHEEPRLREHLLLTYNNDLNNGLLIQQGDETTEVRQPENSSNDGPVEAKGENSVRLSISSLEGTDACDKQEETFLREDLLVTYNNHLNNDPSIQQGDETTDVKQPQKSANDGSVESEGGNSESLSSSSLEGTEEYRKQKESCLREHQLVTYNHHLNDEPSIHQDEEETTVLASTVVNVSNNIKTEESSNVHCDHDEPEFLSEQSFLGKESLQEVNFVHTNSHSEQIKDDGLEKEMESHEDLLTTDESGSKDGNEFGSSLVDTCGTAYDSPSIGKNINDNSLTKVNCTTENSLTSLLESSIVDNPHKFDHEENCKVLYGEIILSRNGSTTEKSYDYKPLPDQCRKDSLKKYKSGMVNICDIAVRSNGYCNGERNILLDSNVFRLSTSDRVEEPKVTENGVPFDAYVNINNSNKASEESGAASEEKHFMVPEAKSISLIAGLTVVDCRHEERESYQNKIEETNEKPEATHDMVNTFKGTEMSEQCNSDLVIINQKESFPMQNNSSLLDIYDDHQDNVKQDKSFTAISMPNSDLKQTNESKSFGSTIDNFDSSKLKVPSVDLVDDEAFEKEREENLQQAEAASPAGAELTNSTATMSIEPYCNNSIFANGGYETRDSVTRLSTESNPDNAISCQMQKSPSFNLSLRKEARAEDSDQIPLLHQDKSANESLSKLTSLNVIKSMPHDEYQECILHGEEMPPEEKIVTMERSYSKKPKAPFIGLLKEEEEAHLLDMPQLQDNHAGKKNAVSSTSKRKEKRKARSSFFSSCMCCATVP